MVISTIEFFIRLSRSILHTYIFYRDIIYIYYRCNQILNFSFSTDFEIFEKRERDRKKERERKREKERERKKEKERERERKREKERERERDRENWRALQERQIMRDNERDT